MTLIERLTAEFGDEWEPDEDGILVRLGEHCDGEPTWKVWNHYGSYTVTYECGWYEQQGDAQDEDDLIDLMHAMVAADRALDESMRLARARKGSKP